MREVSSLNRHLIGWWSRGGGPGVGMAVEVLSHFNVINRLSDIAPACDLVMATFAA